MNDEIRSSSKSGTIRWMAIDSISSLDNRILLLQIKREDKSRGIILVSTITTLPRSSSEPPKYAIVGGPNDGDGGPLAVTI